MHILSIDHVQLAMPEGKEDDARAFYSSILGFSEMPKPPALAKRGGAWFQSGNVRLHLGVEKDFRPARKAHPAFLVDNLDAILEKVLQAGYQADESQPPLAGFKRVHIHDPFGNRIELIEPA
jgi:catechol 2,3-dioxygenase-like lactoylglutathione lyase family enzyme